MIKLATVFSGIGSIEQAMKKMGLEHEIVFASDNGERDLNIEKSEIDNKLNGLNEPKKKEYIENLYEQTRKPNYMEMSYFANYNITKERWYQDVRFVNGLLYRNKVDIFVGGSPCQSFSIIGKRGGLEDARGTLFYDYARLVQEIQPKVFIYENVKGLLTHDKGKTWEKIRDIFTELGYHLYIKILNAKDYGIPQNRDRIFVVGFRDKVNFSFPKEIKLQKKVRDFLMDDVEKKYYLGKKGFEFVTNPKYKNRAQVNRDIMMCQKANQQFNWNGDFVFEKFNPKKHDEGVLKKAYISYFESEKGVIRKLTPKECLKLMGFEEDFNIVVPDVQIYRQAGNSIVVNIFEEILKQIINTGIVGDKND